ncbi:MAG: CsgG/HfaB family protein [Armatimonadota bacterium]
MHTCRWQAIILLLLFACLLAAAPAFAQDLLKDAANKLVADLVQPEKVQAVKGKTLVIAEFENINGKGDAVPRIFQEKLTTAFIRADHFEVVERAQLEKAMSEMKIDAKGLTDPDKRKELGKFLGADYMVVGSVAEMNGIVSFDARIIAIETGRSISAADVSLNQAAPPTAAPAPGGTVDLNQGAVKTDNTGTVLGKPDDFGLLGGGNYRVAWREKLETTPVVSISGGDLMGDGSQRLIGLESNYALNELSGRDAKNRIVMWRWRNGRFQSAPVADEIVSSNSYPTIRTIPLDGDSPLIVVSYRNDFSRPMSNLYRWNGTQFAKSENQIERSCGMWNFLFTDHALGKSLVGVGVLTDWQQGIYFIELAVDDHGNIITRNGKESMHCNKADTSADRCSVSAGDLDGNGMLEMALSKYDLEGTNHPIDIFNAAGARIASTENAFSARTAVWQPAGVKRPYLAASRNEVTEVEKSDGMKKEKVLAPNGGRIFLLQWDGELYDEMWQSPQFGEEVIDLTVCDPKNEGAEGLIVLYREKKEYWVAKVIVE